MATTPLCGNAACTAPAPDDLGFIHLCAWEIEFQTGLVPHCAGDVEHSPALPAHEVVMPTLQRLDEHPARTDVSHHHETGGNERVEHVVDRRSRHANPPTREVAGYRLDRPMTAVSLQDVEDQEALLSHA